MASAETLISALQLSPHPEGGWYREIHRSPFSVSREDLPERFDGARALSATIYYLLERGDVSRLHRLHADELWLHMDGATIEISVIDETGALSVHRLGADVEDGEELHVLIPHGCWFGAEVADNSSLALVACLTSPAFDFADFELGDRDLLLAQFPEHADLIRRLVP